MFEICVYLHLGVGKYVDHRATEILWDNRLIIEMGYRQGKNRWEYIKNIMLSIK